jgi:renalase
MQYQIAVVGAGLAGLVAAGRLKAAGREVVVFEKSRGLGGRLATRRSEHGAFDHGAPIAHCERAPVALLEARQAAVRWGQNGHVGLPGMSGFVRPLADGLDIRRGVEVAEVAQVEGGLSLDLADGGREGPFARVVLAIPAPQARRIAGRLAGAEALDAVGMAPTWTLMAAFADRPDLPDVLRPGGAIDLVVRDGSKPGRSGETWVVHAAAAWTRARLELEREAVLPQLLAELDDLAEGRLPRPIHVAAHRWRFARTERPLGAGYLPLGNGLAFAGGDWAMGSRAEHAWLSGQAMADAVLAEAGER